MGTIAIIAGNGVLPRILAQVCAANGQAYVVVVFAGIELDWLDGHPVQKAQFEKPGRLFKALRKADVEIVTMGGAMGRPRLNPLKFDATGLRLAPVVAAAMKKGDGGTLGIVTALFEAEGFIVRGAHEVAPALLAQPGIPTAAQPSDADRADATRATEIATALGTVDVGQGAIVAQGICLAVESIQGTDAMLRFVADNPHRLPEKDGAKGVLVKLPKPGQDLRVDMPAIGPDTFDAAAAAGLAGVVVTAGAVLVLDAAATVARADDLGLFLWCR